MTLHPYQAEARDAIESGWAEARKQLAVLPTGGGKTILFSHLAQRQPGRTLILAHREELLDQAADKLRKATGLIAEIEQAERRATQEAKVVVGSIQTFARRAERWAPDHWNLIVCDEAHHCISESWQAVLNRFDAHARVLGVTATPDRGDQRNLGVYFERVACEVSLVSLIKGGFLSPITIQAVPLEIDLRGVKSTAGDFDAGALGHALEPYLDAIVQALRKYAPHRRILAFLPLIATSQKFAEAARAAGYQAEHVDGVDQERAEKLARFSGWETEILSNAMLLTEGFDDPGIDCVLVLRPTRSRPLYAQIVGRGTRVDPLKDNLLLLDFLWLHERHSISRPAHLIAKNEEEADAITLIASGEPGGGTKDLIEASGEAAAERESKLAKELAAKTKKKGKLISAEEFALQLHDLALAEYEPTMPWESQPITDKQGNVIRRAGIDVESLKGRGHASKLIDTIFRGQTLVLASPAQRNMMERYGAPNAQAATQAEFRKFIATLKK